SEATDEAAPASLSRTETTPPETGPPASTFLVGAGLPADEPREGTPPSPSRTAPQDEDTPPTRTAGPAGTAGLPDLASAERGAFNAIPSPDDCWGAFALQAGSAGPDLAAPESPADNRPPLPDIADSSSPGGDSSPAPETEAGGTSGAAPGDDGGFDSFSF